MSYSEKEVKDLLANAATLASSIVLHLPIREQIKIAADLLNESQNMVPDSPDRPPFQVTLAYKIIDRIDRYLEKAPKVMRGRIDLDLL